ncbi:MAG: glycosyltransferase [Dehalococcoidia bacterium]|nr:glycosyltransferase [Dehalococcoidia bacterium]
MYRSSVVGLCLSCTNPSFIPFEMLACRCPVVELRSQRVAELLVHGTNAVLAEPTPQSLADAVLTLLDNEALRASIARNGYEMVKDWSWENSARQVEQALITEVRGESVSQASKIVTGAPVEDDLLLYHRSMDVSQLKCTDITNRISGNRSIGQSFICYEKGLYRIDVMLPANGSNVQGKIIFRLKERIQSVGCLVTLEMNSLAAQEQGWLSFRFSPILDSRLRVYYFDFEMPDATVDQGISLCCCLETFPDGSMCESQVPRGGSLTFRTFVMSKQNRLTYGDESSGKGVLALVEQRREELALAQTRLAQSQTEKAILVRHLADAGSPADIGRAARSLSHGGGDLRRVQVDQKHSPGSGKKTSSSRRRFIRGSGGSLISKSLSALRYEGLTGFRREVRSYSRWRLSRIDGRRPQSILGANASLLKKTWGSLRREGLAGLAKEVRNYTLWRLSR